MPFLVIGAVTVPVTRGGTAEREDDGKGKARWRFASAPMDPDVVATLRAAIGTPSGADSDRAWDGTLLTDRPLVNVTGLAMESGSAVPCEVTITGQSFMHHRNDAGDPVFRYVVSLTLREG